MREALQVVDVAALTDRAGRALHEEDHLEIKQKVVAGFSKFTDDDGF